MLTFALTPPVIPPTTTRKLPVIGVGGPPCGETTATLDATVAIPVVPSYWAGVTTIASTFATFTPFINDLTTPAFDMENAFAKSLVKLNLNVAKLPK